MAQGYHAGHQAQGTLSAEDWQSMGKFRARSDPGHPQNRGLSYEAGQLYHSPWSVDAILRSALPGYPENQVAWPSYSLNAAGARKLVSDQARLDRIDAW